MRPSGATALGKAGAVQTSPRDIRLRDLALENFQFIWRSLRRLGVPADAVDDSAQQVFVIVSRRIDDIAPGRERAFLFMSALRVASEARRTHARALGRADARSVEEIVDPAMTPDELAREHEERILLDTVLNSLPEKLRTVFVLFELEELSSIEIAELLNIPVGTVASRLRLAREAFHKTAAKVRASAPGGKR